MWCLRVLVSAALLQSLAVGRLMFLELNETTSAEYSKQMDNQHIMMMGDSLMRYQYLSLVYLIHSSSFIPGKQLPNILMHQTFSSWVTYFVGACQALAPNMHCDNLPGKYENYYYRHKERNITISMQAYAGTQNPPRGAWMPTDQESFPPSMPYEPGAAAPQVWSYSLEDNFPNFAAKLNPRPTTLVINAGHWPNDWNQPDREKAVLTSALKHFERVIWKTTNYNFEHGAGYAAHDSTCNYPGVECFNINWTQHTASLHFRDNLHFMPEIYNDINTQFIQQIATRKPVIITKLDASRRGGQIVTYKDKLYMVDQEGLLRPFTSPPETSATAACRKELSARKHINISFSELSHNILGTHIPYICVFIEK